MFYNIKKIALLLCLHGWVSIFYAQQAFTIQEAINYGLQNHFSVKRNKLNIADSDASLKEYKAIGMPKLNAKIGYNYFIDLPTQIIPNFISPVIYQTLVAYQVIPSTTPAPPEGQGIPAQFGTNNSLNGSLEASMLLFDGSYFVGLQALKLAKTLTAEQAVLNQDSIKMNIKKAYLAVLALDKAREFLSKNIDNLDLTTKQLKEIYKNGFAENLDIERLELTMQNLKTEDDKMALTRELLLNVLKFQMNYPLNQEIVLKEQFDPIYYDVTSREGELLDKYNVESRKEYKMLTTLEELQTLNIKRYKYSYYPTVVGFASHSQNLQRNQLFNSDEPGFFRTTAVGLNVTASIFDGYDRKMKIQRASIAKENVQLNKSIFLTATTLEAANANIQYQNTKQTIEARKKSLDMAEKIFATTKIKFREGVGSSLELTTAERDVYAAQAAYINALYDLIVARVDWEKAMGRL